MKTMAPNCFIRECKNEADFYTQRINILDANGFFDAISIEIGAAESKPICRGHNEYIMFDRTVYDMNKKEIDEIRFIR